MQPTFVTSALVGIEHAIESRCRSRVACPHGAVDFVAAVAEHARFVAALERAGAGVVMLPFAHGAYDSVFAKDSALLFQRGGRKRALVARPRHPERRREQAARRDFYERQGYEVVDEPDAPPWEGGDIVMLPSGRAMLHGHGPRSGAGAAAWLERHAGMPVVSLELHDPHLDQLDMALAVLPDGTAIACESAIAEHSMRVLERTAGIRQIVTVRLEDALAFGLNLVVVGSTVVCGARVPSVEAIVTGRGYHYAVAPLDHFHHAGGSAACLVAELHSEPETGRASIGGAR